MLPHASLRMLLLDANHLSSQVLRARFEREEFGFHVARSGLEALQYLRRTNAPDILVLCIRLPGRKGLDVWRKAKAAY